MTPHLALKLIVPVAFFGYAAFANLTLFTGTDGDVQVSGSLLKGGITQEIDTLYRDTLPHKDPSVGLIGALRFVLLDEGRQGVEVGQSGVLFTAEELRPVHNDLYAEALTRIAQTRQDMAEAGLTLIIAPVPAKIDVMAQWAPDARAALDMAALYDRFQGDLQALGLTVVDTRPALQAVPQPYFATDTHWTPEGAAAVAQAIAAAPVLEPGSEVFVPEPVNSTPLVGDLVSYITSDTLAQMLGLTEAPVTPYRAVLHPAADGKDTGTLDLFGSGGGGVDLVGTSYSANPNWSFDAALALALNRDVVNHAEEGQGPFAPMRAYLDRLDPLALPEAVIWEIPVRYLTDPALVSGDVSG